MLHIGFEHAIKPSSVTDTVELHASQYSLIPLLRYTHSMRLCVRGHVCSHSFSDAGVAHVDAGAHVDDAKCDNDNSPHSLERYGCKNSASILFHKSRFRLRDIFWPVEASTDNNGAIVGDDDDKLEAVEMVACLVRDLPQEGLNNAITETLDAHE